MQLSAARRELALNLEPLAKHRDSFSRGPTDHQLLTLLWLFIQECFCKNFHKVFFSLSSKMVYVWEKEKSL